MIPFQLIFKLISLTLTALAAGIIIFVIKWLYPITQRKITSIDDLKNKRRAKRYHHHKSIIIAIDEDFINKEASFTLNISDIGCLALTKHARNIGDIVWIKFDQSDEIKTGVVRRLLQSETKQVIGIGVEYT